MEQAQFNAYQEGVGFDPIKQIDYTPSLDRRNQRLNRADEQALAQVRRNNQVRIQNAQNAGKDLEALGKLSGKLASLLGDIKKEQDERDMEEGMMLAYTDGVDMSDFNQTEAELTQAESAANQAADEYVEGGGDVFVADKIRGLSGAKKYGYEKARVQKAAYSYPAYYEAAKEEATLTIGDREVTYDMPDLQPEEKAALDAHVRSKFFKQFSGYNPKFLNKYLFPAIHKFEAGEATKWSAQQSAKIQANRIEDAKDSFYTGIKVDPGQTFLDMADNKQGLFKSRKEARTAATQLLEDFLKDDNIPLQERMATYQTLVGTEFDHRGMGRTTVGKAFGRDFGKLEQILNDVQYEGTNRTLKARQDAANQFQLQFEEEVKTKREAGERFTEDDIIDIKGKWTKLTGQEAPSWLKNYETQEDRDDDQDTKRLLALRRSRGYLIEGDLDNVSTQVYSNFIGRVTEDKSLAEIPKEFDSEANERIVAATNDSFTDLIGQKEKSGEWVDFKNRALRAYQRKYQENITKGLTQNEAHREALDSVVKNAEVKTYLKPDYAGVNQQHRSNMKLAQTALVQNPDAWREQTLPGTEQALAEAVKYADTGVGQIPMIYRQLADRYKNLTPFDLMNAQLKASGHPGMDKPATEQVVDQLDPGVQRLLRFKPSASRTNRAFQSPQVGTNNGFLELVKSRESKSYGEYDAYNLGGSNGGHTAHGSGNSAKDSRYGKPLSQMTVREVMNLGSSGRIWAAGAYQFIPSTLKETAAYAGISLDAPFDKNTQDFLAMARARQRMSFDPGIGGLRREWIGLTNVSDAELMKYYQQLQKKPYFDRPENLLPQLRDS